MKRELLTRLLSYCQLYVYDKGFSQIYWCVSMAALGLPVLPLVNCRFATSWGLIMPSKMSRMCSGILWASCLNSSYLRKSLYSPRIRQTVFSSGNVDLISSSCSLASKGPLSKREMVGVVKRSLHPMTVNSLSLQCNRFEPTYLYVLGHTAFLSPYMCCSM